ncbi:hypothetical protein GCM10009530_37570 [Microbispora corallina]|uniref:histidine kinase n=1 Tax=Microbispora corallina TaxID=83302 RepID=A0ABQ4G2B6_9ACTN|nr:PAS domain-containing sensor histidine kinase [Microbispora corallina]GIH41206.1 hypothetical protein Mco01_42060 [Microbispora corallina]
MDTMVDYEAVFAVSPTPSLILTPDLVMVAANAAYLEAIDRTAGELLGRHLFAVFPPNPAMIEECDTQGADTLGASFARVLTTGRRDFMPVQRYDVETPGSPGMFEERYWSTVNTPVLGPGGDIELIIHTTEEVTEFVSALRRSREGVRGARTRLEQVDVDVYARAGELQMLNEQLIRTHNRQRETTSALREAIEQQRRLVFDASHDLRNPITGLLTELEVALAQPDIDLQGILRKLLRDAERLNEIVADLLEVARLDAGTPGGAEVLDLGYLVAEELERHSPAAAALRTRLQQHVMVRASRIKLARLLDNLVANAERHTRSTIEIVVSVEPPEAVLEVIDDGPGIPPADRERVFERLCRLEEARLRDPGGSGLGLPIAREIAQTYGGRLYAADSPRGARLVLRLPLAAA